MLLLVQHVEVGASPLQLERRLQLFRLLRALAVEHAPRRHPAQNRPHAVLRLAPPGAWKTFNTEDKSFWCCTGSGVEEYSKLNDSIYWRDHEGIIVNLFIASEL